MHLPTLREGAAVSARLTGIVWHGSLHKGGELLVLLAIADNASDESDEAYPSVGFLARKTRLTRRQVRYILSALYESGELALMKRGGFEASENRANLYRINTEQLRKQGHEIKLREEGVQKLHPVKRVAS